MALSDCFHRLQSRPCEVHFAGWRSDTHSLQRAGWELSAEQDIAGRRIHLVMQHQPTGLRMLAEERHFDFFRAADVMRYDRGSADLSFEIRHVATDMRTRFVEANFAAFSPINAHPQFTDVKAQSIDDFAVFAPMAEEIIVEPATVAGLLDQIKQLQAPELAAIRERNRRAESHNVKAQRFHAQIVSLAA